MADQKPVSSSKSPDISLIVISSALTALTTVGIAYLLIHTRVAVSEFPERSCFSASDVHICFFKNNLTSDGMIAVLSSFYTNMIVILLAVLTLIGALAALSIRYTARQHVEAELPVVTANYLSGPSGSREIESKVKTFGDAIVQRLEEIERSNRSHSEFIEGFSDRLAKLENEAEDTDTGEQVVAPNQEGER